MYPKHKTEALIDRYAAKFINLLDLSKWKINFHVLRSDSQERKERKINYTHEAGISFISNAKTADIILYYDKQKNKKDALGTLVHELLHLRFSKLAGYVTIKACQADLEEEKIVRTLEKFIVEILHK
jgi:hypothetical protein